MFEAELTGNQFSHLWTAWSFGDPSERGQSAGEILVGYVCFWVVFDEYRLMNLAVEPRWRRRGIARELMQRSLAWGNDAGARRALLEVRASNLAAIRLYEQAGFRHLGVRERYYTNPIEDALMMELDPIQVTAHSLVQR
jgi:ribosomal-protein-alanine N-acetyltransferase